MDKNDIVNKLNNLLEYLYDSRNGYRECAKQIADQRFKNLFLKFSETRNNMISELENKVTSIGGDPKKSDSLVAKAHRIFIDLKSLLTGGDIDAILAEVKRGESTTINQYRDAMKSSELPAETKVLLNKQLSEIENNLRSVDELEKVAS